MLALLASLARAEDRAAEAPRDAVTVDVLGPTASLVLSCLGVPALDGNLEGVHQLGPGLGWSARLDATRLLLVVRTTTLAIRTGPRFSLRHRGLADWTVSPFAVAGRVGAQLESGDPAFRYGFAGVGLEGGRTWVVGRHLALELAAGLAATGSAGYRAAVPSLRDAAPATVTLRPSFTFRVGDAW